MGRDGKKVVLVNLLTGKRGEALAKPDFVTGETYIDHNELVAWGVATGCEQAIREMWSNIRCIQPFIGFIDDGDLREILILRNPSGVPHARTDDTISFRARRLPGPVSYPDPNRIPRTNRLQ